MTSLWLRFFGASLLSLPFLALPAHAQYSYSWIDDHGTRVFSDRPPPPGTPPKRILKAPHMPSPYAADVAPPAPAAADKPAADKAPTDKAAPDKPDTLAEREADFRKRLTLRETDEKKATAAAAKTAEACAGLRRNETELTSGRRLERINDKGEREFVADEERDRLIAQTHQQLAARCR